MEFSIYDACTKFYNIWFDKKSIQNHLINITEII